MTKEFYLDVPHILQKDCTGDSSEMCGAACAQMVLHDIDQARPLKKGEQQDLFSRIGPRPPATSNWYNPPQGIRRVLNKDKPPARRKDRGPTTLTPAIKAALGSVPAVGAQTYRFDILGGGAGNDPGIPREIDPGDQIAQIEMLSRQLIRTVAIKGAAPVVAVREDNAHWIVVNGFRVHDDYNDADLHQRDKIEAILIRNPLGRYTYRTSTCASLPALTLKSISGHRCEENSYLQDIVPYTTWVREYMFSDWAETLVVVCDTSAQAGADILVSLKGSKLKPPALGRTTNKEPGPHPEIAIQRENAVAARITRADAMVRARRAIEDFNLSKLNQNVSPGTVHSPVRVKRLDRIDGDYYLVPVGEGNRISALISISTAGEFNEATVWPNGHYIASFEQHPDFVRLTSGPDSSLGGRQIQLTADGPRLTIRSVTRNEKAPYVWRPSHESFSPFRPFHNLIVTVQGRNEPLSLFLPVDDYCLSDDNRTGVISLPTANYLELLTDCIKQEATKNKISSGDVLVLMNRRGNTVLVMYQSKPPNNVQAELNTMEDIVCGCLNAHPRAGLTHFRIKAFETNAFLTKWRGSGDHAPLSSAPPSGGGENGIPIRPTCGKAVG